MVLSENHVLLLKTQSEHSVDKYETHLKCNGIKVNLVKTLIFDYQNIDILAEKLGRSNEYSGIIFSSPRCVQAVNLAQETGAYDISKWMPKNNFAVGETTSSDAFMKLGLKCEGQSSGAATNLAKYIAQEESNHHKTFLYPHGNLKTDTLNNELEKEGITLDAVLVYDTKENPNIENEIEGATNNFSDMPEYVVFFSPSGLHSSLKYLRKVADFCKAKLIAIGPTTENEMKKEGLSIYGVAKKPTPQDILDIISK